MNHSWEQNPPHDRATCDCDTCEEVRASTAYVTMKAIIRTACPDDCDGSEHQREAFITVPVLIPMEPGETLVGMRFMKYGE